MIRFRIARAVFQVVRMLLLVRLHVDGRENIPAKGPFLVTVNHNSAADTPILLLAFPLLRWRFFAGEKWQDHRFFGPLMGFLGAIFIQRGEFDRAALREALRAIQEGAAFGLAPEGSRSRNGQMRRGKNGAAFLAAKAAALIVPVGIAGSDQLFANAKRLRVTRIRVHIGQPYQLPALKRQNRAAQLTSLTELIMGRIAALLPPSYRGYYAHSAGATVDLADEKLRLPVDESVG